MFKHHMMGSKERRHPNKKDCR